jgi:hypothetical protein
MSANFSQIVALIDRNCKSNSSSYTIADKTADINLALDKVFDLIFQNSSTWNFDDSNHDDYPIITTDLVAGQRDYSFTTDEEGNLILDIFKVVVADQNGRFYDILPVDQQSQPGLEAFYNGQNLQGKPNKYDKTANGIFLDAIPDYSVTGGLKIFINREGSYFMTSDTTKKPGFAGLFHEYLALRPSYMYAYRNSLPNVNVLKQEMLEMEDKIANHFSQRPRDERQQIIPKWRNPR